MPRPCALAAIATVAVLLVGCSSRPKEPEVTRYVFDPNAPVPSGELREQADAIVAIFHPQSDIVQIKPYETFALGAHLPLIVEQVRVSWVDGDGRRHDVLFRIDSDQPSADQRARLAKFIEQRRDAIASVVIEGRADSTGSAEHNLGLSSRRAENVRGELVALGVPPERITTTYFGEGNPLASNATAAGRQRNRSARVLLTP